MKHLLVVCIFILAALFGSAQAAGKLDCTTLTTRAGIPATTFVAQWVDASITLYKAATFGSLFTNLNESAAEAMKQAHISYYGYLISCSAADPSFPNVTTNESMSSIHQIYNITATQFDEYVRLTHQALQNVTTLFIDETDGLYQLFYTFRSSKGDNICTQPGCETFNNAVVLNATDQAPMTFDAAWISITSVLNLTVVPNATVDLFLVGQHLCNETVVPSGIVNFTSLAEGTYYLFTYNRSDCVAPSTEFFNQSLLIVNYAIPVQAPVEPVAGPTAPAPSAPVAEPSAPVAPVAPVAPISEPFAPVAEPFAAPVAPPTTVSDSNSGYIAAVVILVLLVVGLGIAVIVMGVKLRQRPPTFVA